MPGNANFNPSGVSLGGAASFFAAALYDRKGGQITALPNIQPLEVHLAEGPTPATARFAYVFDSTDPSSPFPTEIEQLWRMGGANPYIVLQDDEVLVYEYTPSGDRLLIFDGFADVPQVDLTAEGQVATFSATGVPIRLWDKPVEGCTMRQSDDPDNGAEVKTGLPTWFNPIDSATGQSAPNCTGDGHAVNEGDDDEFPVFLDALLPGNTQFWTLDRFAAYLLWTYNGDEEYVRNPSSQDMKSYLLAVTPKKGYQYYDTSKPGTFDTEPITISSYNATNKLPIDCLAEQLHYYGIEIFFSLEEDEDGLPLNRLNLYRKDGLDDVTPKQAFYPQAGWDLTRGLPFFDGLAIARDSGAIVNEVAIETAPVEYEAAFVLAPGFKVDVADASNTDAFLTSKLATATADMRRKYREFVLDEAGLGHWDLDTNLWVSGPGTQTSLDDILGAPDEDPDDPEGPGVPRYVVRPRPGLNRLVSDDDEKRAWKAELAISIDYTGVSPGIWDGTGTWRSLADRSWNLLADKLGITILADNLEKWALPDKDSTGIFPSGVVRVIGSIANPAAAGDKETPRFWLRLTCKIPDDSGIDAVAKKRDASPSLFTIRRRVDSRDHYVQQIVDPSSPNYAAPPPAVGRDDTDAALAKAQALRGAGEFPSAEVELRVPWITHALGVGDFLSKINGRNVDLLLNDGAGSSESPKYPVVTAISWTCQEPQTTTITLSGRVDDPEAASHGG